MLLLRPFFFFFFNFLKRQPFSELKQNSQGSGGTVDLEVSVFCFGSFPHWMNVKWELSNPLVNIGHPEGVRIFTVASFFFPFLFFYRALNSVSCTRFYPPRLVSCEKHMNSFILYWKPAVWTPNAPQKYCSSLDPVRFISPTISPAWAQPRHRPLP